MIIFFGNRIKNTDKKTMRAFLVQNNLPLCTVFLGLLQSKALSWRQVLPNTHQRRRALILYTPSGWPGEPTDTRVRIQCYLSSQM